MLSVLPLDPDSAWLATLTVLYVEDDETTRDLLARFLRRRVGRLAVAVDGVDGLVQFNAERPALVVTDIQMPRMNGLAMAEAIRAIDPNVPIVVVTAFEQNDYLLRSIDVGVDKYVTKPVDTDKLEVALVACARRLRAEALIAQERQRDVDALRAHEREALSLLAGGMAHDFNNLIQVVLGNVELAEPLARPGTALRELIDEVHGAATEAAELGHRLLTLSNGWMLNARAGPVEPAVRAALAGALAGGHTALRVDLPASLPAVLYDAALLGLALRQIVQNAREAMDDGGVLTVVGEVRTVAAGEVPPVAAGACVRLTFRDSGVGIAPGVLPRIFDPYFSTKPRGTLRGMGLGLSLCQAIVRKHGGAVTAASPPGEGAVFTVLLPIAAAGR